MSKKWITLLLSAFVLSACSDRASLDNTEATEEIGGHEEWADLPEYPTLIDTIGNDDYSIKTVTDNQGKRILLLSDPTGTEKYKSIFIKDTNRLKIIKVDDDGEVFNEILD